MTADQGKEFIARMVESSTPHVVVSDALYLGLRSAIERVDLDVFGSTVAFSTVVFVCPSTSRPSHPRMLRAELGVLPHSLMHQLELFDPIVEVVVSGLHPRCDSCGELALRPTHLRDLVLPLEGFLVASVGDDQETLSLKERCELLGVERAVVGERLTRVDDLNNEEGEAVLAVIASNQRASLEEEIDRWFRRGGSELNIRLYPDRSSHGVLVGSVSRSWRCPSCSRALESPSRQDLSKLPPCERCRGDGWILSEGRYVACRDCEGFGSCASVRNFSFQEISLSSLAALSFRELLVRIRQGISTDASALLRQKLEIVCDGGLGDYPLGAAVEMMSQGERSIVSAVVVALSRLSDVSLVVDGESLGMGVSEEIPVALRPFVKVVIPETRHIPARRRVQAEGVALDLRAIERGPLSIPRISFPIGGITSIRGPVGSGKTLLLATIAERFSKRNKLAHLCLFPGLKRCHRIAGIEEGYEFVLDLVGLSEEIAHEITRTRAAKEAGLQIKDALFQSSSFRCAECSGSAIVSQGGPCSRCGGAIFDGRITNLPLLGSSVGEVLTMPLRDLVHLAWGGSTTIAVIERLIQHGMGDLRLSSSAQAVSPPAARFLAVEARLCRVLPSSAQGKGGAQRARGELVLLDGPRVMTSYQESAVLESLDRLRSEGATVLYADMPQGLRESCDFMVCLTPGKAVESREERTNFLDTRYARVMMSGPE